MTESLWWNDFYLKCCVEKQTYDGQKSQLMKSDRCERACRGVSGEEKQDGKTTEVEMEKTEIVLYIENQGTQRIEITDEKNETHTRGKDSHQEEWKEDILAEAADSIRKLDLLFAFKNPTDVAFMPRNWLHFVSKRLLFTVTMKGPLAQIRATLYRQFNYWADMIVLLSLILTQSRNKIPLKWPQSAPLTVWALALSVLKKS